MAVATKAPSSLAEALAKFQQEHHAAGKDGDNPFFKSKYTTLAQALLAVQPATEFGLCHTQLNDFVITSEGEIITIVITKLMHVSGDEPIISRFPVPKIPGNVKNAHQEAGSAQTYARRYGLLSVYGLANDDDDGNSLMNTPPSKQGTASTPTRPNQELQPVSDKAKTDPPITNEAREVLNLKLLKIKEQYPDEFQKLLDSYKKKFGVSKINPITTAKQGEFLALAISKIDETL